jgi:hypothetical protein
MEVLYGGCRASFGNVCNLVSCFQARKVERLPEKVSGCSSVPAKFRDGVDFTRFVVLGREQAGNVVCAREA